MRAFRSLDTREEYRNFIAVSNGCPAPLTDLVS